MKREGAMCGYSLSKELVIFLFVSTWIIVKRVSLVLR